MKRRKDEGNFLVRSFNSIKHGSDGITYAMEKEINFVLIMALTLVALLAGFLLKISQVELCLVVISMGAMMAAELINCSIEAAVDLITLETNELAKISKDCAGAASLVLAVVSLFVDGIIFIPKIIELL